MPQDLLIKQVKKAAQEVFARDQAKWNRTERLKREKQAREEKKAAEYRAAAEYD